MPRVDTFNGVLQEIESYGSGLKQACREKYGSFVSMGGRREMIPNELSYCEIDPDVVDHGASRYCAFTSPGAKTTSRWRRI